MKFRKDKEIMKFFAASISMVLLGAVLSKYLKPKEYFMPDERTNKNIDKAGHAAFWVVIAIIIILAIFEIVIPGTIIYRDASVMILIMGIYMFILFRWFYNKKGE
jgi:predicted histidine transporter YuiF (NhaC family)